MRGSVPFVYSGKAAGAPPDGLGGLMRTVTVTELTKGEDLGFVVLNRPHSVVEAFRRGDLAFAEQYVLVCETDHLFLKPMKEGETGRIMKREARHAHARAPPSRRSSRRTSSPPSPALRRSRSTSRTSPPSTATMTMPSRGPAGR